jgi:hypothetical protein
MVAGKINDLATKFESMGITSVIIGSYDINVENFAPKIESQDVPMIYFFPAYHKNPPFARFLGSPRLSEIADFIKKNADIEFELTVDLAQQE